jgi:hypothetical protein
MPLQSINSRRWILDLVTLKEPAEIHKISKAIRSSERIKNDE